MKTKNIKEHRESILADYSASGEVLEKTKAYPVIPVRVCATDQYERVPDLLTGGDRKRKFGAVLAMAVIPDLATQQEPVMVAQDIPMLLIDGDTLEVLEERFIEEVRGMFRLTKDTLDGKVVPPEPEDYDKEEE
jgi:hypothetical protein